MGTVQTIGAFTVIQPGRPEHQPVQERFTLATAFAVALVRWDSPRPQPETCEPGEGVLDDVRERDPGRAGRSPQRRQVGNRTGER